MPQNIYMGPCKCIWQIFKLASCKCKCQKFGHVSVSFTLTLDLHTIYTAIDTYTQNTGPKTCTQLQLHQLEFRREQEY
jgi:hypothetical protein